MNFYLNFMYSKEMAETIVTATKKHPKMRKTSKHGKEAKPTKIHFLIQRQHPVEPINHTLFGRSKLLSSTRFSGKGKLTIPWPPTLLCPFFAKWPVASRSKNSICPWNCATWPFPSLPRGRFIASARQEEGGTAFPKGFSPK